jgi:uncharacterized GH25 family protein
MTLTVLALALLAGAARAHDTWVQTHQPILRVGQTAYVDLMLGNHGNNHRDFKLAGKTSLQGVTLTMISPDAEAHDLLPALTDQGLGEKDGYWIGRFETTRAGLHIVGHTVDRVVSYAPKRTVKSAKAFFLASSSLDAPVPATGYDRPLGHPLELVPMTDPVAAMAPGQPMRVRLLYQGKPLAGAKISCIPRGVVLEGDTDARYEHVTDANGLVTFVPDHANYYLIAAHHDQDVAGDGYTSIRYSASMVVIVPGATSGR